MAEGYELIVVGAGPCGIAVGAAARQAGLSCALFDRGCVTSSLVGYPYYMTFFSTAVMLEVGGVPFTIPNAKPTRREALAYYRRVVEHFDLDVRQYHEVVGIEGREGDFRVTTRRTGGAGGVDGGDGREAAWNRGVHGELRPETHGAAVATHRARAVVIATGAFDAPSLLGVPGEELPKVRHRYLEPHPYFDQDVLVVGAGNSAVEAALELYRYGARVAMVHFAGSLDRGVKPWIVPDITNRIEKGEIPVYWRHRVAEIRPESVVLRAEQSGALTEIPNDFVLAMTGWRADHSLLRALGVRVDDETGVPAHDPATMETNVSGVYLAGVVAAGHDANKIFIENGREHGARIVAHRMSR